MEIDEIVEEEVIEESETSEETPDEDQEEEVVESDEEEVSSDEDEEEDRVVTIGDEEPSEEKEEEDHQETPGWVKKVRKTNAYQARKIKQLERQLEEMAKPQEETVELGPEPTLESVNFDDKKFKAEYADWLTRKQKVEAQKAEAEKVAKEQAKVWQTKQERYANLKQEHGFKDFDEAEETVTTTFNQTQQGVIVDGAKDPALVVYALGKNPKKLEELSKIKNPIELAAELGRMEAQLKVRSRKAPAPEKRVSSGKTGGGSADNTLERLRKEAEKSGDYSEVHAYKKRLRQQGAK